MVDEIETFVTAPGAEPQLKQPWWAWREPEMATITAFLKGGSVPVGCLRMFPRILLGAAVSFRAVGIGGVFTVEEFRGRGIGTEMVRRALSYAHKDRGLPLAVLFAAERSIYTNLGFAPLYQAGDRESLYVHASYGIELTRDPSWRMIPEDHF